MIEMNNQRKLSKENKATLELLKSSILVAFSGTLRIYIAFLLLSIVPNLLVCFAGGLIIYTIYTLDRTLGSEEDIINREELNGAKKKVGVVVCISTFLIGCTILLKNGIIVFAFIPFGVFYLYNKGITIGNFVLKLKGGYGGKNLVVGLTWGILIAGLAGGKAINSLPVLLVLLFYGVKLFVNSAIFDFRDIKGDTLAGIRTLPVSIGEQYTRYLLMGMYVLSHTILGIAMIVGILAFEPVVVLYSFVCGIITIQYHTEITKETITQKRERFFLVHGESIMILILRAVINAFL